MQISTSSAPRFLKRSRTVTKISQVTRQLQMVLALLIFCGLSPPLSDWKRNIFKVLGTSPNVQDEGRHAVAHMNASSTPVSLDEVLDKALQLERTGKLYRDVSTDIQ
mmetsp:Transcript_42849/g.114668  ORF Transcript_42849/g.114668 Transcript_42849/m.114668 type:complete len:107 (+) Transcript_42849:284-604(+)